MVKKGVILDTNIAIALLNDNKIVVETIQALQKDFYEFYSSCKSPRWPHYCNRNLYKI